MEKPKVGIKVSFNAPVILGFSFLCFLALGLAKITNGRSNDWIFSVYRSSFANPMTYIRMFGHVFGHSGWEHFIGNITFILVIGPLLEEKYGSKNMVILIATTAVVTGIANVIFFPYTRLLGASGVVFALILLASITSVKKGYLPLTFLLVVVIYLGNQVYEGIFVRNNIANFAHILGGATGAIFGFLLAKDNSSGQYGSSI